MNFVCLPRQAYLRCVCAALNFDVGEIWSWRDDENIQKGKKKSYQSVEKNFCVFPMLCASHSVLCASVRRAYIAQELSAAPREGNYLTRFDKVLEDGLHLSQHVFRRDLNIYHVQSGVYHFAFFFEFSGFRTNANLICTAMTKYLPTGCLGRHGRLTPRSFAVCHKLIYTVGHV